MISYLGCMTIFAFTDPSPLFRDLVVVNPVFANLSGVSLPEAMPT